MSKAAFAQGPWQAKPTGPWDGWDGWSVEDSSGDVVCDAHGSQRDGKREANARLIAAAPELLEALQEAALWVDGELKIKVRAAISKALGVQQ